MTILTGRIQPHWNFFLAIENDLEHISRFIEFDQRNFKCFSLEIVRVLMAASAEVDIVCKQICKRLEPTHNPRSINSYREIILKQYPMIKRFTVLLPKFGLTLHPWINWEKNSPPKWWTANNKIKHERHLKFAEGNLKNMLNSVAGLFVVVLYLYIDMAESGQLIPSTRMFRTDEMHFDQAVHNGHEFGIAYRL